MTKETWADIISTAFVVVVVGIASIWSGVGVWVTVISLLVGLAIVVGIRALRRRGSGTHVPD